MSLINKKSRVFRTICCLLAILLVQNSLEQVQAQGTPFLPAPHNYFLDLSIPYSTPVLRGMRVYPDKPFEFDFVVDSGDRRNMTPKDTALLIKYFLTSLTIPEEDLWVNLSPYESGRIIPNELSLTDVGNNLLNQDKLLKQLASSLTYPESKLGKKFWDLVYKKAYQKFGTTDLPVNTYNKVWIVPDQAIVYDMGNIAMIGHTHLKVMLEADYLAMKKHLTAGDRKSSAGQEISASITKEIILPELEKEINEGKNFAPVRQIFHSIILADWFKRALRRNILSEVYVNKKKISGVDGIDKDAKEKIYKQYLRIYKVGAYNYIREDVDPISQQVVPRKYFSGGCNFAMSSQWEHTLRAFSPAMITKVFAQDADSAMLEKVELHPIGVNMDQLVGDQAMRGSLSQNKSSLPAWKRMVLGMVWASQLANPLGAVAQAKVATPPAQNQTSSVDALAIQLFQQRQWTEAVSKSLAKNQDESAKPFQIASNAPAIPASSVDQTPAPVVNPTPVKATQKITLTVEPTDGRLGFGGMLQRAGFTYMPLWGKDGAFERVIKTFNPKITDFKHMHVGDTVEIDRPEVLFPLAVSQAVGNGSGSGGSSPELAAPRPAAAVVATPMAHLQPVAPQTHPTRAVTPPAAAPAPTQTALPAQPPAPLQAAGGSPSPPPPDHLTLPVPPIPPAPVAAALPAPTTLAPLAANSFSTPPASQQPVSGAVSIPAPAPVPPPAASSTSQAPAGVGGSSTPEHVHQDGVDFSFNHHTRRAKITGIIKEVVPNHGEYNAGDLQAKIESPDLKGLLEADQRNIESEIARVSGISGLATSQEGADPQIALALAEAKYKQDLEDNLVEIRATHQSKILDDSKLQNGQLVNKDEDLFTELDRQEIITNIDIDARLLAGHKMKVTIPGHKVLSVFSAEGSTDPQEKKVQVRMVLLLDTPIDQNNMPKSIDIDFIPFDPPYPELNAISGTFLAHDQISDVGSYKIEVPAEGELHRQIEPGDVITADQVAQGRSMGYQDDTALLQELVTIAAAKQVFNDQMRFLPIIQRSGPEEQLHALEAREKVIWDQIMRMRELHATRPGIVRQVVEDSGIFNRGNSVIEVGTGIAFVGTAENPVPVPESAKISEGTLILAQINGISLPAVVTEVISPLKTSKGIMTGYKGARFKIYGGPGLVNQGFPVKLIQPDDNGRTIVEAVLNKINQQEAIQAPAVAEEPQPQQAKVPPQATATTGMTPTPRAAAPSSGRVGVSGGSALQGFSEIREQVIQNNTAAVMNRSQGPQVIPSLVGTYSGDQIANAVKAADSQLQANISEKVAQAYAHKIKVIALEEKIRQTEEDLVRLEQLNSWVSGRGAAITGKPFSSSGINAIANLRNDIVNWQSQINQETIAYNTLTGQTGPISGRLPWHASLPPVDMKSNQGNTGALDQNPQWQAALAEYHKAMDKIQAGFQANPPQGDGAISYLVDPGPGRTYVMSPAGQALSQKMKQEGLKQINPVNTGEALIYNWTKAEVDLEEAKQNIIGALSSTAANSEGSGNQADLDRQAAQADFGNARLAGGSSPEDSVGLFVEAHNRSIKAINDQQNAFIQRARLEAMGGSNSFSSLSQLEEPSSPSTAPVGIGGGMHVTRPAAVMSVPLPDVNHEPRVAPEYLMPGVVTFVYPQGVSPEYLEVLMANGTTQAWQEALLDPNIFHRAELLNLFLTQYADRPGFYQTIIQIAKDSPYQDVILEICRHFVERNELSHLIRLITNAPGAKTKESYLNTIYQSLDNLLQDEQKLKQLSAGIAYPGISSGALENVFLNYLSSDPVNTMAKIRLLQLYWGPDDQLRILKNFEANHANDPQAVKIAQDIQASIFRQNIWDNVRSSFYLGNYDPMSFLYPDIDFISRGIFQNFQEDTRFLLNTSPPVQELGTVKPNLYRRALTATQDMLPNFTPAPAPGLTDYDLAYRPIRNAYFEHSDKDGQKKYIANLSGAALASLLPFPSQVRADIADRLGKTLEGRILVLQVDLGSNDPDFHNFIDNHYDWGEILEKDIQTIREKASAENGVHPSQDALTIRVIRAALERMAGRTGQADQKSLLLALRLSTYPMQQLHLLLTGDPVKDAPIRRQINMESMGWAVKVADDVNNSKPVPWRAYETRTKGDERAVRTVKEYLQMYPDPQEFEKHFEELKQDPQTKPMAEKLDTLRKTIAERIIKNDQSIPLVMEGQLWVLGILGGILGLVVSYVFRGAIFKKRYNIPKLLKILSKELNIGLKTDENGEDLNLVSVPKDAPAYKPLENLQNLIKGLSKDRSTEDIQNDLNTIINLADEVLTVTPYSSDLMNGSARHAEYTQTYGSFFLLVAQALYELSERLNNERRQGVKLRKDQRLRYKQDINRMMKSLRLVAERATPVMGWRGDIDNYNRYKYKEGHPLESWQLLWIYPYTRFVMLYYWVKSSAYNNLFPKNGVHDLVTDTNELMPDFHVKPEEIVRESQKNLDKVIESTSTYTKSTTPGGNTHHKFGSMLGRIAGAVAITVTALSWPIGAFLGQPLLWVVLGQLSASILSLAVYGSYVIRNLISLNPSWKYTIDVVINKLDARLKEGLGGDYKIGVSSQEKNIEDLAVEEGKIALDKERLDAIILIPEDRKGVQAANAYKEEQRRKNKDDPDKIIRDEAYVDVLDLNPEGTGNSFVDAFQAMRAKWKNKQVMYIFIDKDAPGPLDVMLRRAIIDGYRGAVSLTQSLPAGSPNKGIIIRYLRNTYSGPIKHIKGADITLSTSRVNEDELSSLAFIDSDFNLNGDPKIAAILEKLHISSLAQTRKPRGSGIFKHLKEKLYILSNPVFKQYSAFNGMITMGPEAVDMFDEIIRNMDNEKLRQKLSTLHFTSDFVIPILIAKLFKEDEFQLNRELDDYWRERIEWDDIQGIENDGKRAETTEALRDLYSVIAQTVDPDINVSAFVPHRGAEIFKLNAISPRNGNGHRRMAVNSRVRAAVNGNGHGRNSADQAAISTSNKSPGGIDLNFQPQFIQRSSQSPDSLFDAAALSMPEDFKGFDFNIIRFTPRLTVNGAFQLMFNSN